MPDAVALGGRERGLTWPRVRNSPKDVSALGSTYLRDITSGSNGACGAECTAGPGYDTVTGLGSPTAGVDAALAAMK